MFTTKQNVCKKCGHIYNLADSSTFLRTSIKLCPNCGSDKVETLDSEKQAEKKSKEIKGRVKTFKKAVLTSNDNGIVI